MLENFIHWVNHNMLHSYEMKCCKNHHLLMFYRSGSFKILANILTFRVFIFHKDKTCIEKGLKTERRLQVKFFLLYVETFQKIKSKNLKNSKQIFCLLWGNGSQSYEFQHPDLRLWALCSAPHQHERKWSCTLFAE